MRKPPECMKAPAEYMEQDFDLDPLWGLDRHTKEQHVHGSRHRCHVCCNAPLTALSDYGYLDFTLYDDDGEPEWVGLCWECAKPVLEAE